LGIRGFASGFATAVGCPFLSLGFLLRVWATFCFYEHRMKVVSLEPQKALITTGPYGFSRNPLYLGGNVFIFFGAALSLGSPTALFVTAIHIPLVDLFIRREDSWRGSSARHGFATRTGCEDGSEPTRLRR
jgi:protein-S-isoprenylcysteine O-methyltransferase Ste14